MKKIIIITVIFFTCFSLKLLSSNKSATQCYDPSFVDVSTATFKSKKYVVIMMNRKDLRIKAKYFAAPDNGKSVYRRYLDWSARMQNIILVSSGTYMNVCDASTAKPVGLTIDNGIPVNRTLISDKMDALCIVYAAGGSAGGIAVSNLVDGDLTLKGSGVDEKRKFNLRGSVDDLDDFMEWAKGQEATVFQTHLLVYKNSLKVSSTNSSTDNRERRFLAVGKDKDGQLYHIIVNYPENNTLYESSKNTLDFLNNFKEINVTFMLNLDTGCQDVIELRNSDCSINKSVEGKQTINNSINLLAYYFQ